MVERNEFDPWNDENSSVILIHGTAKLPCWCCAENCGSGIMWKQNFSSILMLHCKEVKKKEETGAYMQ